MLDHTCVLEWRYGSSDMRKLFSASNIVNTYVKVEASLIKALTRAGMAPAKCVEEFEICSRDVKPEDVYEREKLLGHDIASLTYILGERCGECGRYVHLGATSYDIVDTTWALLIKSALSIVTKKLKLVIERLVELSLKYLNDVAPGRTHNQHAVPITFGFKFANYVYELTRSYERLLDASKRVIRLKMSGAVGTMAAWGDKGLLIERLVAEELGLEPHVITTQVAPRDGFAELISVLAILASQLDRFALEVRELSRPEIDEMYESAQRIGSSTMPHKRNPVISERISGLAKVMRGFVLTALENIPLMHERDLTNSSSERIIVPHAFLTIDQMLEDILKLLEVLYVNTEAGRKNLDITRGLIYTEMLVMKLVERGWARHTAHSRLMSLSRKVREGETLVDAVLKDPELSKYFTREELEALLQPENYIGCVREIVARTAEYAKSVLGSGEHP
ncbi:MAG: adenylosuccinate lyase [Desulfurococcaceae archaeon]